MTSDRLSNLFFPPSLSLSDGFSFDAMYAALPATQGAVPGSPTRFDANAFSEAQMQAAVMASGFRPEMYMAAMQGQFLCEDRPVGYT